MGAEQGKYDLEAIPPGAPALAAPPAPPAPSRSLSTRAGTDDAAEACLGRCGGATLRAMLGVSREWARRAHNVAARADWLEAAVVGGEGEARTAEIGWALAHGGDLQELLRRLPAVARLRAGGAEAELGPLLSAPVLDERLLKRATGGGDEEEDEEVEGRGLDECWIGGGRGVRV